MITALLLSLVLQSPPAAPTFASCSVVTVHKGDVAPGFYPDQTGRSWDGRDMKATKTRTVYACDAFYGGGSVMQVTVPKAWFAQHCTTQVARDGETSIGARCDEVYMGAGHPAFVKDAAAPRKNHPHLQAVGYGAASLAVLAVCIVGGCGFMGGGGR
jgi:hypothetical protein